MAEIVTLAWSTSALAARCAAVGSVRCAARGVDRTDSRTAAESTTANRILMCSSSEYRRAAPRGATTWRSMTTGVEGQVSDHRSGCPETQDETALPRARRDGPRDA